MSSWFYGLVREKDGKIRIWEITQETDKKGKVKSYWGYRGINFWMLKDLLIVIKDLLGQRKYIKALWDGKELEKGTKKQINKWNKDIKKLNDCGAFGCDKWKECQNIYFKWLKEYRDKMSLTKFMEEINGRKEKKNPIRKVFNKN